MSSDEWCSRRHDGHARCTPEAPGDGGCFTTPIRGGQGENFDLEVKNLKACANRYSNVTLTLCSA